MVYNAPFGMYPYGPYGFNNMYSPYNPQLTGAYPQLENEGGAEKESEKESGADAFISNKGHGKNAQSTKSDLALSVGIGACVAALAVIFTRHLLKPKDISKFVGETKNLSGKVAEEVKTIVPEVEKTIPEIKNIVNSTGENIIPKFEATSTAVSENIIPKFETTTTETVKNIAPEVETSITKAGEDLTKKQTFESEKEFVSSKFPKAKTLKDAFADTYEKGESVLNKVPHAETIVPEIKTNTSSTIEKATVNQNFEPEKEFVSSKFPKAKTFQETFKNTYENGESVLNKVPYAGDIKKETAKINKKTPPRQKGLLERTKDRVLNFFSNKTNKVKNSTNFSKDNDLILMSKKAGVSKIKNVKPSHPSVEEIFEQQKISSKLKFEDYDRASKKLADKNLVTKTLNNVSSSFKINNGIEEIIAEKAPNYIEYLNQLRNNPQPIEELNKFVIELEKGKWGNFPKDPDYKSYYLEAIKSLRK